MERDLSTRYEKRLVQRNYTHSFHVRSTEIECIPFETIWSRVERVKRTLLGLLLVFRTGLFENETCKRDTN